MIRRSSLSLAVLATAAPLAALASETFLGLAPCALCLWQRWPYWVAAVLALLAAFLRSRGLLALAALAVLVSGGLAVLHVGVEQQWWPSPLPSCRAPAATLGLSVDDMLKAMAAKPDKPCDAPTYVIPGLPVTIAQLNLLYALLLSGFGFRQALRRDA